MLLQTLPSDGSVALARSRRYKGWKRRIKRDLRLLAPLIALVGETVVLASTIVLVEGTIMDADVIVGADDYGVATISINSTSNVSTAPPGILPGEPLSP